MARRIGIGFRVHTGWAAGVAVAGDEVIARARIALGDDVPTEELQVFHAAAEQPFAKAEWMIEAAVRATEAKARASLAAWLAELPPVARAGIVAGNMALPGSLETILASHALIHAAEGEMFRQALAKACSECGLPVLAVPGKTLLEDGARQLGLTATQLRAQLAECGRSLGAPWGQDQKEATLVARLALRTRKR